MAASRGSLDRAELVSPWARQAQGAPDARMAGLAETGTPLAGFGAAGRPSAASFDVYPRGMASRRRVRFARLLHVLGDGECDPGGRANRSSHWVPRGRDETRKRPRHL